jgi:periplasmic protein TonB
MMRELFNEAGARRLWVAAGLSVALHAAIVVSVQRQSGGTVPPMPAEHAPLIARLAAAVTDAVLPTTPPVPAAPESAATRPAPNTPPGQSTANDTPAGSGTVHYFKSAELDRRPFPLSRIEVPPPEMTAIEAGSVIIKLLISERGRVEDATIVMGTGIPEFEAAALREFSQARFQPGYRANLPVRSEMLIEVTLRPPTINKDGANPAQPKS